MSGKNTPENKDVNHEIFPHREHQLYEYYANDLLAHAEATQAKNEQDKRAKSKEIKR